MGRLAVWCYSTLAAVVLTAMAGAAVAGPFEDAAEAHKRRDFATALRLLRPLADQRDVRAQTMLAEMYLWGQGTPKDYAATLKLLQSAADLGWWPAKAKLGYMYELGLGVPVDLSRAKYLYLDAADRGIAFAQIRLGGMYLVGKGAPRDFVLAHMWINLAVAAGNEWAKEGLVMVEELMTPSQVARARKLAREWKPQTEDSTTEASQASSPNVVGRSPTTPPVPHARAQQSADCFPNLIQYDICAKAKEIHSVLAATLPMRLNANMTMNHAAVIGPAISLVAIWHIDNADLRATLRAHGMSDADLKLKMDQQSKTMACGQQVMGAFIRLGGKMQYIYRTQDGVPVHSTTVESCPVR
ncbi:MAG: sel1 repeat family protein [Xanthobacteraceae bacterium]|nr:sel1 repeat family protein [Xanthobacteraceae bacterium]